MAEGRSLDVDPERAVARLIATKTIEAVKIAPTPAVCQLARRLRMIVPLTTDPLGFLNSAQSSSVCETRS
jgi:hypothetical protein